MNLLIENSKEGIMKRGFLWFFVTYLLVSFCIGNPVLVLAQQKEKSLDKVTLRMSWLPYIDYAMYVVGAKKGFYRQEGIGVSIQPAKGSDLSTKLVGNREDQFAAASAETTLIARSKGMPLKVLAILHQTTPTSIFSLEKTPLSKPKDLEGKSLASDPSSLKHNEFKVFCKLNNVDINKINIIPIKGSDFIYLLNGNADTMLAFDYIGHALLRKKGHKINEIKLADYGVDALGIGIITHEELIKENPDLVKRFVRASMKSWDYAVKHPEEAVDALVEAYPELNKQEMLDQMSLVISHMQSEDTKKYGIGYQSQQKWEKTQDLLYDQVLIDKKIDLKEVYTNEFLSQ